MMLALVQEQHANVLVYQGDADMGRTHAHAAAWSEHGAFTCSCCRRGTAPSCAPTSTPIGCKRRRDQAPRALRGCSACQKGPHPPLNRPLALHRLH